MEKPKALEQLECMENVIESIDLALFAVNADGVITVWNKAMSREILPKEQAIGKHLLDVFPHFKEENQGVLWGDVILQHVMTEGRSIDVRRYKIRTRSGAEAPYDIRAYPLVGRGEKILGAVVVMSNVKDRVELEEQMILNARTTSLSNLGASLAHEIRNPLNSISLNVQLLKEQLQVPSPPDKEALITTIEALLAEIGRLNLIVRDFLEFSKPLHMRSELVNPNEVIGRALELLKEEMRRKNISVVVDFGELPEILMDENQITQVFYNIALNAVQALGEGKRLEITSRRRGDWVVVEFADDGPGIAENDLPRVFDLFFSTKKEGTGLGLAIASKIVENHHGHISVKSKLGEGAIFTVSLPAKIAL